jgi:predicted nucleotidyltransferase
MEQIEFPRDFTEFLRLLHDHEVDYLLVGGFAVALHGYARTTADIDVWVSRQRDNAERIVACLKEFGFDLPELTPEVFMEPDRVVRMGNAPLRIEILTDIDGVVFDECRSRAVVHDLEGGDVRVISLEDLKRNKRASGRPKDLDDLSHLP